LHILIVGAGIAGLTAALALMRDGHTVEVYEQADKLAELGAGVQISANGARVLFALGLEEAIRRVWCEPAGKEIRLWNTGETWKLFDLGAESVERYGAPPFEVSHSGGVPISYFVKYGSREQRDLLALKSLGEAVNARTRSMGVALTSCTVPAAGKPTFQIGDTEMEMGVGIHGEPGRRRVPLKPADEIATEMVGAIVADLQEQARGEALLLVNGFGGTPLMELYLMYHAAQRILSTANVRVVRSLVGNYVTSLEMAGCSITVCMLTDELKQLWDAPVHTAALRWGA